MNACLYLAAMALAAMTTAPVTAIPGDASSRVAFNVVPAHVQHQAAKPEQISIRFRDLSVVDGETVRLGDVARVMAGGERAVAALETLVVAKSAGFGLTRMLDTELLFSRVLQPFSDLYEFDYDKKVIRISTRAEKYAKDSLAALIEAFVQGTRGSDVEVRHWEIARSPAEILVPVCPHRLEIAYAGAKRKGKVDLTLSIRDSSRILRSIPITINLRIEAPVLVAKRQITRDQALVGDNVTVEMRETTLMNDVMMGDPKKLLGYLAKVNLNPGRVITPRMVAIPPTVKRGQEAKIIYRNGSVSVTADAVCRQDGLVGQVITAKSLASQRLVRVRVTEDGWLEPVPGG